MPNRGVMAQLAARVAAEDSVDSAAALLDAVRGGSLEISVETFSRATVEAAVFDALVYTQCLDERFGDEQRVGDFGLLNPLCRELQRQAGRRRRMGTFKEPSPQYVEFRWNQTALRWPGAKTGSDGFRSVSLDSLRAIWPTVEPIPALELGRTIDLSNRAMDLTAQVRNWFDGIEQDVKRGFRRRR